MASVAGVIALLFAGRIRRLPVSPDGWKVRFLPLLCIAFLVLLTHKWGLGHRVGAPGGGSAVSRFDGRTNSSILRGPLTKIGLKRTIFLGKSW